MYCCYYGPAGLLRAADVWCGGVWKGVHPIGHDLLKSGRLRILNVNCNGLRKRKRGLALGRHLASLRVGLCLATESHLRKMELEIARIPGYELIASFCRVDEGRRVVGGALFLVAAVLKAEAIASGEGGEEPIETCSAHILPVGGEGSRLTVTGVYFPPSRTW